MVETSDHIINKEVFEFNYTETEYAFVLQKQMNAGLQFKMQNVIANVLYEWDSDNKIVQLNKLEIDLGEIPFEQMTELAPQRFYTQFKEKFTAAIATATTTRQTNLQGDRPDNVILLEIFLLSGSLPWWAGRTNNIPVNEIIDHLLKNDAGSLRSLLARHINNEQFNERLFYQTDAATYVRVLELLDISPAFITTIEDSFLKWATVSHTAGSSVELRKKIFYLLIKLMAVQRVSFSNEELPSLVLEQLIKVAGGPFNQTFTAALLHDLVTKAILPATKALINETAIDEAAKDIPVVSDPLLNCNEKIYIQNTGLILIAPFLPALFKQLQWTNEEIFMGKEMQFKALFILHYICTGETAAPEYTLQLNKILCGLKLEEPIPFSVELTEKEKQEADLLLKDIITHWSALKNSSVEGLQGSFLMRDGLLSFANDHWLLQAERKGYDILLEQAPWSWRMIKLTWMDNYIDTEW